MTRRTAILAASLTALAFAVYAACNPEVKPTECDSYVAESCGGEVTPPSASGVKAEADCGRFSFELQGVGKGSEKISRTRHWFGGTDCWPDEDLGTEPRDLPPSVGWEATDSQGNSFSGTGSEAVFDRGSNVCSATCTFTLTVSPTKCSPPEPVKKTGTAVFENAVTVTGGGPRVCTTSESHSAHRFPYAVACAANKKSKVTGNAEKVSDDGAAVIVRGKAAGDAAVTVSADCGSDEKSFDVVELDRLTLRGCGCIDGDDPAFETMEGKGEVTATLTTTPAQYSDETYTTVDPATRTAHGWFDCERDGVEAEDEPRTNRTYEVVRLGGLQVLDTNGESRVDADLMRLRPGLCYEVRNTNAYTKTGQNVLSVADFAVLETNVVSVCPTVETSSDGWMLLIPTNEVKASFTLVLSNTCHTCDVRRVEGEIHPRPCAKVGISHYTIGLDALNSAAPDFGLPFVINTNFVNAESLVLETDVHPKNGDVHFALEDMSAPIEIWMITNGVPSPILDENRPSLDIPFSQWAEMTGIDGNGDSCEIWLLSRSAGSANVRYRCTASVDNEVAESETNQVVTAILPPLLPDYNRDGGIDETDARISLSKRHYIWTNRDIWKGDDAFDAGFLDRLLGLELDNNGDDSEVNGRNDLVNLFPFAIRAFVFQDKWGADRTTVRIRARENGTLRRCYSNMPWREARKGVLDDISVDDESSWWKIFYDPYLRCSLLKDLSSQGDVLDASVVSRGQELSGVVFLEGVAESDDGIELIAELDGNEVLVYRPQVKFSDVDKMYRWHNIRSATDDDVGDASTPERQGGPEGWPDDDRDDAHLFFVHGYNVSSREAREWGRAFFKRMWWSGMNSKFHVVTWYGNDSQIYVPLKGLATPNYHINVEHAFASSTNLVAIAQKYLGRKYFVAHSLGNMLVSSSIHDWGMPHDKYMLLNAAVPIEAYDTSSNAVNASTINCMMPREWVGYDASLKAANWYTMFDEGDGRRKLTWKGRFSRVVNAVNYYSTEEDVLRCGDGEWRQPLQRTYSWYNQERIKGVKPFELGLGRNEGGWGFNTAYYVEDEYMDDNGQRISYMRKRTADEMTSLLADYDVDLMTTPFFGWFEDHSICTNALLSDGDISLEFQSQLLADAIPAESLPAGRVVVLVWDHDSKEQKNDEKQNHDMAIEFKDTKQIVKIDDKDDQAWSHSFFLQVPYMMVHQLFENIFSQMKEGIVK